MPIVFKYKAKLPFRGCLAFLLEIHLGIKKSPIKHTGEGMRMNTLG